MTELTDEQLLKLATIAGYDNIEPGEYEEPNERAMEVYGSELVASMRAAIAADRGYRGDRPPGMVITADPGVAAQREEVLTAFVAKHGCQPDGVVQIGNILPDGRTTWHLERRPQPTAEALQASYKSWVKRNYGMFPTSAAAESAAAFTLAVLLGEVEL